MNSFTQRVYDAVTAVPKGRVATYGQIAAVAGSFRAARAVGNILHNNPLPGVIPCHRVVSSSGRLAPGFAFGGPGEQQQLLAQDGVLLGKNGLVDLEKYGLHV